MIETEFPDWFSLKCKYWINFFIAASILASEFSLTNENLNSLMVPIDIKVNGHFFFPSLCLSNPKHYKKKLVCRCALLLKCLLIKWHQKVITKRNLNFWAPFGSPVWTRFTGEKQKALTEQPMGFVIWEICEMSRNNVGGGKNVCLMNLPITNIITVIHIMVARSIQAICNIYLIFPQMLWWYLSILTQ